MTAELAIPHQITREQRELLKRTIAKDASDDELALFVATAERTGLDPFARQIHCVIRNQKVDDRWQKVMSIQTGIDGYRLIAERTGRYEGRLGPFWCGKDGEWRDVWLSDTPPAAAKVGVCKAGIREPFWSVALWAEYKQTKNDGHLIKMWERMPAGQLAKCAESLALRAAFPMDMSGVYTHEEMAQAYQDPAPIQVSARRVDRELEATLAADTMPKPPTKTPEGEGDQGGEGKAPDLPSPSGNIVTDWAFEEGVKLSHAASFLRKKNPNSYGRFTDKSLETLPEDKAKEILQLLLEWHAKKEPEA